MKNYINTILFSVLVLILPGCEKNNPPVLTGGITGNVSLEDVNQYILQDQSGVKVDIINDENSFTTQTDKNGDFRFIEVPFGKYYLNLTKAGFTDLHDFNQTTLQPLPDQFFHLGGEKPTRLTTRWMFIIPDYAFHLDSALYRPNLFTSLLIFGPPPFESVVPRYYYYPLFCFFNDTPNVSKDHYLFYAWGFMNFLKISEYDPPLMEIEFPWQLANVTQDSIYICVYSVSGGENQYTALRFESLGKPSNVIGFAVR